MKHGIKRYWHIITGINLKLKAELRIQAVMLYAYIANIIYAIDIVKTPINIFTSEGAQREQGFQYQAGRRNLFL